MSHEIYLINRETGENETLGEIDEKLCQAMGVEPNPDDWCVSWVNALSRLIGFGDQWENVLHVAEQANNPKVLSAVKWLSEHYRIETKMVEEPEIDSDMREFLEMLRTASRSSLN